MHNVQVSFNDWEASIRKQTVQFDFRESLFDTVVSIGICIYVYSPI